MAISERFRDEFVIKCYTDRRYFTFTESIFCQLTAARAGMELGWKHIFAGTGGDGMVVLQC